MPRPDEESNTINRVLKAWGLPSLDQPDVLRRMGYLVENHRHFTELLKACDPTLRREMYEAISPHLRFTPKTLEGYISAAKEYAEAAQLPVMDEAGNLHPYSIPQIEVPPVELLVVCMKCGKEGLFYGERLADAIHLMRTRFSWAHDETGHGNHLCPECLDAMDAPSS